MKFIRSLKILGATLAVSLIIFSIPMKALAATTNPTPAAKVSFTFDDGFTSAYSRAAPTLAKYGLVGTDYVPTGCIGSKGTCAASPTASYMTWPQVQALQNNYGWEIGSHTINHVCLATNTQPDCPNTSVLTQAQVMQELVGSKQALASNGINATSFASPYGDYNNAVLAQIAKVYTSHRGFADQNNNGWPYNDYLLNDFQVQEGTTVAQVKAKIDAAIANNYWLVLTMHDIKAKPSKNPSDYEYSTAELDQIAQYVKTKQTAGLLQSVKANQGLVTSDVNLLPNGSFNDGIADGWTTDSPATVTKDTGNNGSYPDPANSIKLVSSTTTAHLFSPTVSVDPNTTYMLKNFLNVQSNTGGQVAFYIDEYDANGNWVSGQYRKTEGTAYVENMNFTYKPTSIGVTKASLQVIVTGNSGITAYLDNSQWFPLTVTPPTQTNLVANGTFDAGIADGWTTDDPANIIADTNNNGSPANPVNSVKLIASTKNTHLFSPQIAVDATKSYSLSSYLNLKQLTGAGSEVGFYIDEYDANGNWISGQYKTGVYTVGAANVGFQYTTSSINVKKASLQVIVVGNSNIVAYIDNVQWLLN